VRGVKDALWHSSINLAELLGRDKSEMLIDVEIGVAAPLRVDPGAVAAVFPYGQVKVRVVQGGLDIPRPDGLPTVLANVAILVSFEMEEA
jgi:uncharacterized protein (TIGR02058 family)